MATMVRIPPLRRRALPVLLAYLILLKACHLKSVTFVGLDVRMSDFDVELLVSKALSFAVIGGSCFGKLPQVAAVWRAKSAEGISKISIWTETVSMGVQLAYNVVRRTPVTTYAEIAILFPQLLLLTLVVAWADENLGPRVWLADLCLCVGVTAMALGWVSSTFTTAAYTANALFGLVAVLPQVIINYKNKSTGQLSFLVTAMTFGGTSARLYTTFVEVDDLALQLTMMLNWSLVSTLMLQFAVYRDRRPLPAKPASSEESPTLEKPSFKRQASVVKAFASFGSSRCLSEMVEVEMMDGTVEVIKSKSSQSLSHFARSISWSTPMASNSLPCFDIPPEFRQVSSPPLRRN